MIHNFTRHCQIRRESVCENCGYVYRDEDIKAGNIPECTGKIPVEQRPEDEPLNALPRCNAPRKWMFTNARRPAGGPDSELFHVHGMKQVIIVGVGETEEEAEAQAQEYATRADCMLLGEIQ